MDQATNSKNQTVKFSLLIGLKLLLICAVVAGIVSFVYAVTLDQYQANLQETKNAAIGEIFGKTGLSCEETETSASGVTVYLVKEGDELLGYCAEVKGNGFGGDIEMMVGYGADRAILGVSVISNSETPGVGSKVMDPSYLERYRGLSGNLALNSDVDAVSGATISSKGVLAAVNAANDALTAAIGGN